MKKDKMPENLASLQFRARIVDENVVSRELEGDAYPLRAVAVIPWLLDATRENGA